MNEDWCRSVLARLGWAVESLSDEEIARELHHRWFANRGEPAGDEPIPSPAVAHGIITTMMREGNLDALCWTPATTTTPAALESSEIDAPVCWRGGDEQHGDDEPPRRERRKSRRANRSDVVRFTVEDSSRSGDGWLVDVSPHGVAFIVETKDAPEIGTRICPTVHARASEPVELGLATVVRTELLNDTLGLVCARRGPTWETEA